MNKPTNCFLSDVRNIGGRIQVFQLSSNHKWSLKHMKPILSLQSPHPHVNAGRPPHNYIEGKLSK